MPDFNVAPINYGQLIGQAQNLVPDPMQEQAQQVVLQNARIQGQQAQQQMAIQRYALQRQQMFGQDLQGYIHNPTASGLATLYGKYPEYEQQAAAARGALNQGDITELGSAASLAAKQQYGEAAKVIQGRYDAEQAAGTDPSKLAQTKQVLDLLNSNDPQQQKAALGMLSLGVAVAVGPEKAAEFMKANGLSSEPVAVGMDQRLINPATGEQVVGANPKMESITTNNPDGSSTAHAFNPYTGKFGAGAADGSGTPAPSTQAEGGGPASGGGATTGGLQASVAHVLKNEGGYNPSDMNGSPTNFGINFSANKAVLAKMGINASNFKNMTQDQASQIYANKYWPQSGAANLPANMQAPYFDVYVRSPALAKRALAQSGGDPAQFAQITNAAFQKMAANNPKAAVYQHAWAARDAGNAAIATGQAPNAVPASGGGQAAPAQNNPYEVGGSPTGALNTKGAEPGHAWNADHTAQIPVPGTDADPAAYKDEVEPAARIWALTGQFPTGGGGMGGGGQLTLGEKNAISKRGMEILQGAGYSGAQIDAMRSRYSSDKMKYNDMNGIVSSLTASENALKANSQQVLKTQAPLIQMGIIRDGAPNWVNSAAIEANEHLGSGQQGAKVRAAIKAYRDSVNAFSQEYSKFMTAANGVGGSAAPSDSARQAAGELNDESMGPTALKQHIAQVMVEAANRRNGFQQQQQVLSNKLDGYLQAPASAGAVHVNSVAEYHSLKPGTRYIDPNGVTRVKH